MINVAIFASGEGTNAENLFNYFANDSRIKIKLVVTNKDDAGIILRAAKYKKNVHILSKSALQNYSNQFIEFLKVEHIDLIVLAGFLLKIPIEFINAFPNKIINLHPSLLPKYGGKGMFGKHVHQAVIDNNEKQSGITIHFVNENYDEGAVIFQAKCFLEPDETATALASKIHELEQLHFPKVLEQLLQKNSK
jgi:phosphoribosylglycinamide formyltransferase-1